MSEIFSIANLASSNAEFIQNPHYADQDVSMHFLDVHEKFMNAKTRIAVQKDGELTNISASVIREKFGAQLTRDPKQLLSVSEDGEYGFLHARNKALCDFVMKGTVDYAIVGTDRVIESGYADELEIVESYRSLGVWSMVLATKMGLNIDSINDIGGIATQYPILTARFLAEQGLEDIAVLETDGGTEAFPYIEDDTVDGIIDMTVTGRSLKLHAFNVWEPAVAEIFPVLIKAKNDR